MRMPKQTVATNEVSRGDTLPERVLGPDALRRVESSCPGDTFMAPASAGEPSAVIERWVAEAELTGETDNYLGKRQYPRFSWNVIVLLRIKSGDLAGKIIRARTKNVSLGGLGVQLRSQLAAGTEVDVSVEGRPFCVRAEVVHCTKAMAGNLVGLLFLRS
ncbi:MAG: PilZ domain-containing protein [Phycisphaerales bacterium]|nr:PilZ domain-containing protein [Phycisphaerales bacterium]